MRKLVGLTVFPPPVYQKGFYNRVRGAQALMERIDRALAPHFPWKYLGANTFYLFEREADLGHPTRPALSGEAESNRDDNARD